MEEHCGGGQQKVSRWCLNTIVTSIIIAISTMTIATEREVGVIIAKI